MGDRGLGLMPYLVDLDGLVVVDVIHGGSRAGTLIDLDGSALMRKESR